MKLRNLTPHSIKIYYSDGDIVEVPSEGQLRVSEKTENVPINGLPVIRKKFGTVDLPPFETGVYLIVSIIVLNYGPKRPDLLSPDTGPESVVRDLDGKILGVRRLICQ